MMLSRWRGTTDFAKVISKWLEERNFHQTMHLHDNLTSPEATEEIFRRKANAALFLLLIRVLWVCNYSSGLLEHHVKGI
jgi:hypothetical protein